MLCEVKTQDRHCSSAFNKNLNLFSVFFALYYFVSHTKYSVSLRSETNETNPFSLFRFAHISFLFASFRFEAKFGDTLGVKLYGMVDTTELSFSPVRQRTKFSVKAAQFPSHRGVELHGIVDNAELSFLESIITKGSQYPIA